MVTTDFIITYANFPTPPPTGGYSSYEWTMIPLADPRPVGWGALNQGFLKLASGTDAPNYVGVQSRAGGGWPSHLKYQPIVIFSQWGGTGGIVGAGPYGVGHVEPFFEGGSGWHCAIRIPWIVGGRNDMRMYIPSPGTIVATWNGFTVGTITGVGDGRLDNTAWTGGFGQSYTQSFSEWFSSPATLVTCADLGEWRIMWRDYTANGNVQPASLVQSVWPGWSCPAYIATSGAVPHQMSQHIAGAGAANSFQTNPAAPGPAVPRVVLEAALTSQPADNPQVYTEITNYLREDGPIRMKRGRQEASQKFSSGRLNATLDNRTRKFDPALDPNVKPERMVRYSLEYPWLPGIIPNGGFEQGTTGWTVEGGGSALGPGSGVNAYDAANRSYQLLCASGVGANTIRSAAFPVVGDGTHYCGSVRLRPSASGTTGTVIIDWYSDRAATQLISSDTFTYGGLAQLKWNRCSWSAFAPIPAQMAKIHFGTSITVSSMLLQIDSGVMEVAPWEFVFGQWEGSADSWQRDWEIGDGLCQLSATDAFKVLGRPTLNSRQYRDYMSAIVPRNYYRLGETGRNSEVTSFVNSTVVVPNAGDFLARSTIDTGVGPLYNVPGALITDNNGAFSTIGPSSSDSGHIELPASVAMWAGPWLMMAWYRNPQPPTAGTTYGWLYNQGGNLGGIDPYLIVRVRNDSFILIDLWDGIAGHQFTATFSATANGWTLHDGLPHLIAVYYELSSNRFYMNVDGLQANGFVAGPSPAMVPPQAPSRIAGLQIPGPPSPPPAGPTSIMEVDEFANWWGTGASAPNGGGAPTAVATVNTWCSDLYNLARRLYPAEQSGTRINRLLDLSGWPSAKRVIDAGSSQIGGIDAPFTRANPLQELQKVESTERGWLFIDRDGNVRWLERHALFNSDVRTAIGTFGTGAGELPYTSVTPVDDDRLIINHVEYAMQNGGAVQIVDDVASQADFWVQADTASDLQLTSDEEVKAAAGWVVDHHRNVTTRISKMTFDGPMAPDLLLVLLTAEIGQRVIVHVRPVGITAGTYLTYTAVITGIAHTNRRGDFRAEWDLETVYAKDYFLMDDIFGSYPMGW